MIQPHSLRAFDQHRLLPATAHTAVAEPPRRPAQSRSCLPALLSLFLLAFVSHAVSAATRKPAAPKPAHRTAPHAANSHSPAPHTAGKHAAGRHTPKSKPSHARARPGARKPPRNAPVWEAPDNAIAAAPAPRPQLAEAPVNPFTNVKALDPFFHTLALQQTAAPDAPNAQSSVPTLAATVRILQFGDSHTAADLFTGALRALLQSRFGNGGLGFQFPGHPFAGYHLAGSTRSQSSGWFTEGNKFTQLGDGDLGLGGISISTSRPGEIVTLSTTCTTLQVHFLRQPGGGRLRFTDNGVYISDIDTSAADPPPPPGSGYPPSESAPSTRGAGTLTYACTAGQHDFTLTTEDDAPVRLLGLVTEQPGITYECLGINGAVAPLMLRWNQALFAEYLRQRAPALIVLAYGTNEAAQSPGSNEDYVFQFHRILQNLHRIVPAAAILVLGPYDRAMRTGRGRRAHWQTYSGTDRIVADQKQACRIDNCAFYDQRTRMGGPGAMLRWVSAGLAQSDRTHLTGPGYRTLAEALYRDLMSAFATFQQTTLATLTSHPDPATPRHAPETLLAAVGRRPRFSAPAASLVSTP